MILYIKRKKALLDIKAAVIKRPWYWLKERGREQWKIRSQKQMRTNMSTWFIIFIILYNNATKQKIKGNFWNKWCCVNWISIWKRNLTPIHTTFNKWYPDNHQLSVCTKVKLIHLNHTQKSTASGFKKINHFCLFPLLFNPYWNFRDNWRLWRGRLGGSVS